MKIINQIPAMAKDQNDSIFYQYIKIAYLAWFSFIVDFDKVKQ
jgi:hypothetical protein